MVLRDVPDDKHPFSISAKQLERELRVTYKTAYRMFKQIRTMFEEDIRDLCGTVETDETFMGGKEKNKHTNKWTNAGRGAVGKQPLWGAMERGGRVVASIVPDTKSAALMPQLIERVMPRATVFTDEALAYDPLTGLGYGHKRVHVHHAAKVYVEGDVHVNSLEGFWSLVSAVLAGAPFRFQRAPSVVLERVCVVLQSSERPAIVSSYASSSSGAPRVIGAALLPSARAPDR